MYFSSIANLIRTPSDRQMYPQGYMYPRLGTFVLEHQVPLHKRKAHLLKTFWRRF